MPTSRRLPMRPLISTEPLVGRVIRERIFRRVLFPAPFRPMMPRTSPRLSSKETSFRAQNSSDEPLDGLDTCSTRRLLWSSAVHAWEMTSRKLSRRTSCLRRKLLLRPWTRIAMSDTIYTRSANVSSMRRKYSKPPASAKAITATATASRSKGGPASVPKTAQRNPSTMPVIGFRKNNM